MVENEIVFCRVCHRKLKNPIYKKIGLGKICLEKFKQIDKNYLFEVNNNEITDKK